MRNSIRSNTSSILAIGLLLAIVIAFAIRALNGIGFDTDLFAIIPEAGLSPNIARVDRAISAKSGRETIMLVSSSNFSGARDSAIKLYEALGDMSVYETLSLYTDGATMDTVKDIVRQYRDRLLPVSTANNILASREGARAFATRALERVYSPFTISDISSDDPFLLEEEVLQGLVSSLMGVGGMSPKDGVLHRALNGREYILLRGRLLPEAASVGASTNAVRGIYSAIETIEARGDCKVYLSGVPFHSYESSTQAQKEITIISIVSLILVVVILVATFGSIYPVLLTMLSIVLSSAIGLMSVFIVSGRVHILTLVFGTTLIGTSVDYSIHYFFHALSLGDPLKAAVSIRRGLTLSLLSTLVCQGVLIISPFYILRQAAIFSAMGLICSYMLSGYIFPLLPIQYKGRWRPLLGGIRVRHRGAIIGGVVAIAAIVAIGRHDNIRVHNDIHELYTMSARLQEGEATCYKVINLGASGCYYLVSGASPEELMEREYSLVGALVPLVDKGALGGYMSATRYIPPPSVQGLSLEASRALEPLLQEQYIALGYDEAEIDALKQTYINRAIPDPLVIGVNMPSALRDMLDTLVIGEVGGAWYSVVMPTFVQDEGALKAIAQNTQGVTYINKAVDIGHSLDILTSMMLKLYGVSLVLVGIALLFIYKLPDVARICAVPAGVTIVTVAIEAAIDVPWGFFHVTALALVFGLGLDYIIYITERRNTKTKDPDGSGNITDSAITLSFITTAISFGALALSHFTPVSIFSSTVLIALSTAFLASKCLK